MQTCSQVRLMSKTSSGREKSVGGTTRKSRRVVILILAGLVAAQAVSTTRLVGAAPPSAGQPSNEDGGQPEDKDKGKEPKGPPPGEDTSQEAIEAHEQQEKLAAIDAASAADQATLQKYLRDADPIIGAAAFDALGVHNMHKAVEALLEVVNDPTEPVRLQALQLLLGSAADEATIADTLRAALEDPDPAFVAAAVQALGGRTIDPNADEATLRDDLRDADSVIVSAAFDALAARDKDAAVDALLEVIDDTAEPSRLQALQLLLSSLDAEEATLTATLRAALEDPDFAFVASAVGALAGRSDAEALSALAEALRDGDVSTRLLIVQSIAGNSSAAPLLQEGQNDPDETVRNAATAILLP